MGQSDGNLVGIIGAGRLGQAMARTARRAGREVVIANSRGPESLASVVSALGEGVSAGTADEAAAAGIVVIAVPWDRVPGAVQGHDWSGQVVVDATNDWAADDLDGKTSLLGDWNWYLPRRLSWLPTVDLHRSGDRDRGDALPLPAAD